MQGWLGWAYVAVTLGYLAAAGGYAWALGSLARDAAARWLARVTWAVHTGLLAVAVATGHVPFLSPQGSVFFLGWGWVLNGLVLESLLGLRALGAFMLPPVVALLVLNRAGRRAPYYFLDPESVGMAVVVVNIGLLAAFVLALGYGLSALGRPRRARAAVTG